ncbi:MAG: DUF2283 domain-containing protein [Candidatus Omnitrophota bacterium]
MAEKMKFYYDKRNDILDISVGKPKKAVSKELGKDILIRVLPQTNKIVGLTVLNFEQRFSKTDQSQSLPIEAEFVAVGS